MSLGTAQLPLLCDLTAKSAVFKWSDEYQVAFEKIKANLCTAPVLAFPVPEAKYILNSDTSDRGIKAVLSQQVPIATENGELKYDERVLAYASRSLSKHERNYCVTTREMLAVVTFIRYFHLYLYGKEFVASTDHAS